MNYLLNIEYIFRDENYDINLPIEQRQLILENYGIIKPVRIKDDRRAGDQYRGYERRKRHYAADNEHYQKDSEQRQKGAPVQNGHDRRRRKHPLAAVKAEYTADTNGDGIPETVTDAAKTDLEFTQEYVEGGNAFSDSRLPFEAALTNRSVFTFTLNGKALANASITAILSESISASAQSGMHG